MTSILIADDHPIVLSGARGILRDTLFEVVATAANGIEALELAQSVQPDILVLDYQMPGFSGLDVLRKLRARADLRPVVLLTAQIDVAAAVEAIGLGVNGLVLKEGAADTLIACLTAVAGGGQWIDQSILEGQAQFGAETSSELAGLSPREHEVAGLVLQGMRNREIADRLGITEGTVKLHLYRTYEKLGVTSRMELIVRAQAISNAGDRKS